MKIIPKKVALCRKKTNVLPFLKIENFVKQRRTAPEITLKFLFNPNTCQNINVHTLSIKLKLCKIFQ